MRHKFPGDALRQHGGHFGAQADELDVRDGPQLGQQPVEPLFAQEERIAAGQEHVADLGRSADVVQGQFQPLLVGHDFALPHHPRAGAIAAITRTRIQHQQQDPVRIAVDESRHGAVVFFAQGVVGLAVGADQLMGRGDDGPAQRLPRIVAGNQAHVVGRDAEGEHRPGAHQGLAFLLGEHQHLLQLSQGADPMAGLPTPVVPVLVADVAVESPAKGPGLGRTAGGAEKVPEWTRKSRPEKTCRQCGRGACDARGQANRLTGLPGGSSSTSRRQQVDGPPASMFDTIKISKGPWDCDRFFSSALQAVPIAACKP